MNSAAFAIDRARHADFYRRAAAKGKAGGAKGKGKYVKGSGQKGVCGPGGGAACHKGYRPGVKALQAKAARSGMLGRMQQKSRAAVGASAVAKAGQEVAKARKAIVAAKSAGAAKAGAMKAAADKAIGGLEAKRAAIRAKGDEARAKLKALDAAKGKGGGNPAIAASRAKADADIRKYGGGADPATMTPKARMQALQKAAEARAKEFTSAKAKSKAAPAKAPAAAAPQTAANLRAYGKGMQPVAQEPKAKSKAAPAKAPAATPPQTAQNLRAYGRGMQPVAAGAPVPTRAIRAAVGDKGGSAPTKLGPEAMKAGRKRMDDAFKASPGAAQNRVKASEIARGMKGMAPADKAAVILKGIQEGKYKIVGKDKAGTDAILARLKARASGKSARFAEDADFARRGFYAKKAGAADKAAGRKHVKGSTPKGVCGPGGGRACHKGYQAKRGTETRKALAAEARAARAASRGGAAGATAAARAAAAKEGRGKAIKRMAMKSKISAGVAAVEKKWQPEKAAEDRRKVDVLRAKAAVKEGRGKAIGRLVGKSRAAAAVREQKSVARESAINRAKKVGQGTPLDTVRRANDLKAQISTKMSSARRNRDKKEIARLEKAQRRVGAAESRASEAYRKSPEVKAQVKAREKAYDERVRKEQSKAARVKPLGRIVAKSKEATRAAVPVARAKAREEKKARTAARRAELKPLKGKVDRAEIARQAREYRSMQLLGGKAGKATNEEIRRVIRTYAAPKGTAVSKKKARKRRKAS